MAIELLEWLAATPLSSGLRRSALVYMAVNAAHILSIGLLIGAILPLDLRLMGLFGSLPLAVLGPFLSRAAAVGLVGAVLTGFALFSVKPIEYAENPAFLAKLGVLVLGILNAAVVHAQAAWRRAVSGSSPAFSLRLQAGLSAAVWTSALLAGRWIGFV
ncbi:MULTISPECIES: DUF6644 family protein [unclassified Rhizobium]|uniref:DUF6644 family protein n=1 Tax=unclassified Rhizobium TaxID=2613769 RepID=UPI001620384A|nr:MULTISPECIES: DUF6644 family protein [unclassified Rhizobium]MBB3314581.1 hypothetical protein [Rhizobium sp. BK181]MBB3539918.1 hypothetical protein [Rhizobium sp. BK399]MCS3739073.1 hypothetical protein [Rhizobium sp. BK661]MCS4090603.1 hypothetical protein [Rhizobium sp. BK176]